MAHLGLEVEEAEEELEGVLDEEGVGGVPQPQERPHDGRLVDLQVPLEGLPQPCGRR